MLQRAADNAYSWWWASHIRTKQSKWLEHNLQDMEEKVKYVLEIIEEDGDSFAKRAEMYYKKRPELITFVEDTYKSYRALGDRYDHLSRELQNANSTIATIFPEQVQFSDDEDDDYVQQRKKKLSWSSPSNNDIAAHIPPVIPKAKFSTHPIRKYTKSLSRKEQIRKEVLEATTVIPSGLTRAQAVEEIDRMQKEILALQTEKEFVRGCYESGYAKHRGIERQIVEKQMRVSRLQDEFAIDTVIEDDEARTLMAATALRSCQDTLCTLQDKQRNLSEEARVECTKIDEAIKKLQIMKTQCLGMTIENQEQSENEITGPDREYPEREPEPVSSSLLTMSELACKIDELVNKVISMETVVSSQSSLISGLQKETGELKVHIQNIEEERHSLIEGSEKLRNRIKDLEDETQRVRQLHSTIEHENHNIETQFTEASCHLHLLSQKLETVKQDQATSPGELPILEEKGEEYEQERENKDTSVSLTTGEGDDDWKRLSSDRMEDAEMLHLFEEYAKTINHCKEVQKKLTDAMNKNRDYIFGSAEKMIRLKDTNATVKDEEIVLLQQKLNAVADMEEQVTIQSTTDEESHFRGSSNSGSSLISTPSPGRRMLFEFFGDPVDDPGISCMEAKLRKNIDSLSAGTMDYCFRFSALFNQLQKFQRSIDDLQSELQKLKTEGIVLESEMRPIYKHLHQIHVELVLFSEQNSSLKEELKTRASSLCGIEVDIMKSEYHGLQRYRAAQFQGQVMIMNRENDKILEDVKDSLDHAKKLQDEVEKTLRKLDEDFDSYASKNKALLAKQALNRPRIPLKSFLFGVKLKKHRQSIFSCVTPAPHKRHNNFQNGIPFHK